MKRKLMTFALAVLTVGLLGSCSKMNERIDNLEKKVDGIENNQIATIGQQIAAINQSIADLETIRTNVQTLMDAKTAMGEDITKLKAADQTLEGKINDLKTYVDKELAKYATKDWANATFASLAKQTEIITDVEKLKTDLAGLDDKLDQAIADLDSSLKGWVNEQLSGYYTAAEINVKIDNLKSDIEALEGDNETNKTKIEELETSLTQLTQDLATAKSEIKAAYEKAISDAINGNNGYINSTIKNAIDAANANITALTGRVTALESDVATLKNDVAALKAMIQTVSIIPAYTDGSVKVENDILTINCVITPKEAVSSLEKKNFTILVGEALTKAALYKTLPIANDEDLVLDKTNGTATIKVDVSSVLPEDEGKGLTVALNVKNGISDYTTEFVPVYVAPGPVLPDGALKGAFTVNADGKKVYFSKGNLYWDGDSFEFEANQYEFQSSWNSSHVSHFFWSKTASIAYADSYKDTGAAAGDVFFTNATTENAKADFTVNGVTGQYRTLSAEEWKYLINNNGDENIRKGKYKCKVKVCENENCLVLAPDNFTGEIAESYDVSTWTTAEAAGLVCLPAAGYRQNSSLTVNSTGGYWYSYSKDKDKAYYVYFNQYACQLGVELNRNYGFSVRLITESK